VRIAILHLQAGLHSGLQNKRVAPKILHARTPHRINRGRHDGANRHTANRSGVDAVLAQHGCEEHAELIRRSQWMRGLSKLQSQPTVKNAAVKLGVADVEAEKHGSG
jgi:hypothetical protein